MTAFRAMLSASPRPRAAAEEARLRRALDEAADDEARNAARWELVLRVVPYLARLAGKRAARLGDDFDELFSEAILGVFEGTLGFDPRRGRWTTHATIHARKAFIRRSTTTPLVAIPAYRFWKSGRAERPGETPGQRSLRLAAAAALRPYFRVGPGPRENEPDADFRDAAPWLDPPDHRDHADADRDEAEERAAALARVWAAFEGLCERDRLILTRRLGLDGGKVETLEQVGRSVGITKEGVRLAQNRALARLRAALAPGAEETP
jgi:RNA polymerase sigma factor (sigma-70 family)